MIHKREFQEVTGHILVECVDKLSSRDHLA